jgi:ribosomal protein S18 acetylase RimI-like enzyme
MDSPIIRPAEPSDYDRIVSVMDDWWGRPVRAVLPRLFLDHFAPTSLIADDADAASVRRADAVPGSAGKPEPATGADGLAGFLVGFMSPSRPQEAYIHFAGVSPRHRRTGLARRLYARFFQLAREDGRSLIRAITSPQNAASIAFHSALGFTVTGPVPDYHGPGADRVLFELHLAGEAGPGTSAAA